MEPLLGLAKYLAYINMALVLFNLIPGYPLDGGRVFRAIVWAITGNMGRSTLIAANVGRFFAFLLIFAGVWQMFSGNFWWGACLPLFSRFASTMPTTASFAEDQASTPQRCRHAALRFFQRAQAGVQSSHGSRGCSHLGSWKLHRGNRA
jgi:Zn-dependent protease